MFDAVAKGDQSVDDAVAFLKDELHASFTSGIYTERRSPKSARSQASRRS